MSKEETIDLMLRNGLKLQFIVYECDSSHESTHQMECRERMLTIIDKTTANSDFIDLCKGNSDCASKNFVVCEYIGRESCSENWYPDMDAEGLTDNEINEVLSLLEVYKKGQYNAVLDL